MVGSLPADAGDTGLCPGPGKYQMPWSGWAREAWPLSLRVRSLCSAMGEATTVRGTRTTKNKTKQNKNICISTNKLKLSLLFPITLPRAFSQNGHWSPGHYPDACVILHQVPWGPVYLAWPHASNRLTTYNGQLRFPPFENLAEQSQNIPSPPRTLVSGPKKTQRLLSGRGAGMNRCFLNINPTRLMRAARRGT